MPHTLREAAKAVGRDRSTLVRAIRAGRLSASRDEVTGAWLIEPAELHRIYPPDPAEDGAERMNDALGSAIAGRPIGRRNGAQAAAQVEIRELRAQLAAHERSLEDLRRRLDAEAEERRRLTMVLADMRQAPPASPMRRWWPWADDDFQTGRPGRRARAFLIVLAASASGMGVSRDWRCAEGAI